MQFCNNMSCMYILKVKKFWVCAYLCLDSIEESIEGDANLHHPLWNRVKWVEGPNLILSGSLVILARQSLSPDDDTLRNFWNIDPDFSQQGLWYRLSLILSLSLEIDYYIVYCKSKARKEFYGKHFEIEIYALLKFFWAFKHLSFRTRSASLVDASEG